MSAVVMDSTLFQLAFLLLFFAAFFMGFALLFRCHSWPVGRVLAGSPFSASKAKHDIANSLRS
jgi:hypothetical protein